ncbi:MAG TPA: hypothetical protein VIJ10_10185 [Vicinamibacteria bacterium]
MMRAASIVLAALVLASAAGSQVVASREQRALDLASLRGEHAALAARLEAAVGRDRTARRVFEAGGDVAIAVRSAFVGEVAAEVAHQYLDEVELDLSSLRADADGEVRAGGWLGRFRVGSWQVAVTIERLRGTLEAGHPRLRFQEGRVDVSLPVRVKPTKGTMVLAFSWDTAGVANVVCADFEARLALDGRVLEQRHELSGELRLTSGDDEAASPVLEQRRVPLQLDLSSESWAAVEAALRSQDSLGRCGLLLKPEAVLARLRELAARGISVRLPEAFFRPVRLPATLERRVTLGNRTVELSVRGAGLHVSPELVWSTASIEVAARK